MSIRPALLLSFFALCLAILFSACTNIKRALSDSGTKSQFSSSQNKLILNGGSEEPMRVFKIDAETDSILLRQKSEYVVPDFNDQVLKLFVERMHSTVTDKNSMGVGIAAPQVGILKNIIWVQRFDKPNFPFEEYLNPRILQYSEMKQIQREGCLSIPNRTDTLNCRSYAILIEYDRLNGEHKIEMGEDFTAIIFQQEIDHLNGILYTDHLQNEIREARGKK